MHPDQAFADLAEQIGEVDEADLLEIGHFATTLVIARTKHGVDVDGRPFAPYSEDYIKARAARGLSSKPDLAVTGHMLGGLIPQKTGPDEVSVRFLSPVEAEKAAAHNYGVDKQVTVSSHRRSVAVNAYTGQRVSKAEASKDKRRKNKKVTTREESVTTFTRRQHTPKREFADVRMPRELDAIAEVIEGKMIGRIEKTVK